MSEQHANETAHQESDALRPTTREEFCNQFANTLSEAKMQESFIQTGVQNAIHNLETTLNWLAMINPTQARMFVDSMSEQLTEENVETRIKQRDEWLGDLTKNIETEITEDWNKINGVQ